jgi:pyruvate kinase
MNVARINCSHGDWATRRRWIKCINELQPKVSPIGILVDLQGPKFRLGTVEGGSMKLKQGGKLTIAHTGDAQITIPDLKVWDAIRVGDRMLLGDGEVEIAVVKKKGKSFLCKANCGGTVRSRQGLTLVGKSFTAPPLTAKDKADLKEALDSGADFIALSYVRRAKDIDKLRNLIDKRDPRVKTVAKVETREALDDIDNIARSADVVMVARGDLGLQMAFDEVPVAQKRIIKACNAAATPVITATQMLESMIHAPRPTRAEASDVANAILDGTDAVMLSGETAMGEYPVASVRTMAGIALKTEPLINYQLALHDEGKTAQQDTETDSVAHAAVGIATTMGTRSILTSSTSGMTPRLVSRYRPQAQILCVAWTETTQRQLSVVWGVESALAKLPKGTDAAVAATVKTFLRLKRIKRREKVVVTAGVPAGVPGNTNMILVLNV